MLITVMWNCNKDDTKPKVIIVSLSQILKIFSVIVHNYMENITYFSATFSIALLLLRMLSSTLSILTYCNAYAILIIS